MRFRFRPSATPKFRCTQLLTKLCERPSNSKKVLSDRSEKSAHPPWAGFLLTNARTGASKHCRHRIGVLLLCTAGFLLGNVLQVACTRVVCPLHSPLPPTFFFPPQPLNEWKASTFASSALLRFTRDASVGCCQLRHAVL